MAANIHVTNASPWATCPQTCSSTEVAIRGVLNEIFVGLAAVFMVVIFGIGVSGGKPTSGRTAALVILMLLALTCAALSMSSQGVQLVQSIRFKQ